MAEIGALSDDEKALLLEHRARREAKAIEDAFRLNCLRQAAAFETWLQEHGRGPSFSAFINEFGYQGADGRAVYQVVTALREVVVR
jgi:hypothetical protein